jgi:hypothetical protein
MFKKIDGYYWVKTSETSKVGYSTLNELFAGEFYYGYIGLALLSISAMLNVAVGVINLLSK